MPRLIDARGVALQVQRNLMPNADDCGMVTVEDAERYFLRLLDKATTVDAVEVVRCRDCGNCEEYSNGNVLYCAHWGRNTEPDGYCHECC